MKTQTTIIIYTNVWLWTLIYQHTRNWTWKPLTNSNFHNFWFTCLIVDYNISRWSKLDTTFPDKIKEPRNWLWKLRANSNYHNFTRMSDGRLLYIEMVEIEHENYWQIQTTITFDSDVWMRSIIYPNPRNWLPKPRANSNWHNFWHGYLIADHNISRPSKLIVDAPSKFKLALLWTQMFDCGP